MIAIASTRTRICAILAILLLIKRRHRVNDVLWSILYWAANVPTIRYLLTFVLHKVRYEVDRCQPLERGLLEGTLPPARTRANHTHGSLADNRSASVAWMMNTLRLYQYTFHDYQTNRFGATKQSSNDGAYGKTRLPFWAKDLDKLPALDQLTQDVVLMTDVDQYVDLGHFQGKPILMFTFQPQKPADTQPEYYYSVKQARGPFGPESCFEVNVQGGSKYTHGVWDYNKDVIVVKYGIFPSCGYTVYRVTTRPTNDINWRIVFLAPVATYGLLGRFLTCLLRLEEPTLKRLNCVTDRVAAMRSTDPSGETRIYCALADGVVSSSIGIEPHAYDSARVFACSNGTHTLHGIQQRLLKPDLSGPADLLSLGLGEPVRTTGYSIAHYREPVFEPSIKKMIELAPPLAHNMCFVADVSGGNYNTAIENRVVKPRPDVQTDNQITMWVQELLDTELSQYKASLAPYDGREVRTRQSLPRQRKNLLLAENIAVDADRVEPFQKNEAYGEIKDPRLITPSQPTHKFNWSRFQYPVADFLKQFKWYAFGKTPKEIAAEVTEICAMAERGINDADSSRHDGRVSALMRASELNFILFLYPKCYHADILHEWKRSFGQDAVIYDPADVKHTFNTGFSRGSGSAETSNFNTLDTRLAVYIAWRIAGLNCHDAWAKLCICGGDDLHAADISDELLTKAYKRLGFAIKTNWIERGALGVNFLSRFYGPGVWNGYADSICDIPRTLSKFHTTVNLSQVTVDSKEKRMLEKAAAYNLTDASTPYVGHISRALLKRVRGTEVQPDGTVWWAQYPRTQQWPNRYGPWMLEYLEFWGITDFEADARQRYTEVLWQYEHQPWELLNYKPIWIAPLTVPKPTLVNEELLVPLTDVPPTYPEARTTIPVGPERELKERVAMVKDSQTRQHGHPAKQNRPNKGPAKKPRDANPKKGARGQQQPKSASKQRAAKPKAPVTSTTSATAPTAEPRPATTPPNPSG